MGEDSIEGGSARREGELEGGVWAREGAREGRGKAGRGAAAVHTLSRRRSAEKSSVHLMEGGGRSVEGPVEGQWKAHCKVMEGSRGGASTATRRPRSA